MSSRAALLNSSAAFEKAQRLITALLDVVNLTLPVEDQQFIGPPGFEYVPYGADDLGWV